MSIASVDDDKRRVELWASLAMRHTKGIGARRARRLADRFGSAYAAVEAEKSSPGSWLGIAPEDACSDFAAERWRAPALEEWRAVQASNTPYLLLTDPGYPELLRETCDSPLVLYFRGDVSLLRNPMIGVVGSRDCTREGLRVCALLARELSAAGLTVVSGMARGIDRAAHLAGLSGPGSSVAVLGTGVDVVYPPDNADLAELLARQGLIVSEFAPGTFAHSRHFPVRNRIISGLCLGVLVVEASERSGSLITARSALEQNREVFAVPGHTTAPMSEGCRGLIRNGAKVVFSVEDILVELAPLLAAGMQERLRERPRISREKMLDDLASPQLEADLPLPFISTTSTTALPSSSSSARKPSSVKREKSQESIPPGAEKIDMVRTPNERAIVDALRQGDAHIDDLCRLLALDVGQLSGTLATLEIRGAIKRLPGMLYSLS